MFLKDSIKDRTKVKRLLPEFVNQIADFIKYASGYNLKEENIKKDLFVLWEETKNYLRIFVTEDDDICRSLNNDNLLLSETKNWLLKMFKFEGNFKYETDPLPF